MGTLIIFSECCNYKKIFDSTLSIIEANNKLNLLIIKYFEKMNDSADESILRPVHLIEEAVKIITEQTQELYKMDYEMRFTP